SSSRRLSAQDTVDRLLRLHFRDGRTRVNGDAQLLMAEMLNVFVRGERTGLAPRAGPLPRQLPNASHCPAFPCPAEAAARAARQAQTEDLGKVDTEHLEKVLPQLVCNC
ncbi:CENPX protein, partial [Onychorhynchus coronatus]|nr:CENPX protein [Onychorhynchus coronatus]